MPKVWNVAIYARVSTDKKEQQESIPAQVQSLKNWLTEKSKSESETIYNMIQVYEDAGFSGVDFDRDSFIRMKEDIEQGKINMVLTRDLSRFSRNYVAAGYYLEDYFRVNGVRFVSTLDNVDTLQEVNDIIPFKNIINEMYIRDCSRRTKDALRQRMLRGSSIASRPPYGYMFEIEIQGNLRTIKLTPANDETTEIVKEIFNLYLNGWGYARIATYLNKRKILPPGVRANNTKSMFRLWNANSIKMILQNPKYGGIMVQQRWKKLSYKIKKVVLTDRSEWIIGGEFEGIIDRDTFYEVQKLIKSRERGYRYKNNNIHPFSTVLVCNECGGSMCYRKAYKGYKCANSQAGGGRCTAHSIKEEYLIKLIAGELSMYTSAKINRDDIYKEVMDKIQKWDDLQKRLKMIDKEISKLDDRLKAVYDDKLNDLLNERNFKSMLKDIQDNQDELIRRREILLTKQSTSDNYDYIFKSYKDKIDRILSFQELDRMMVESFVDRIIVSEDKSSRDKKIDIYFKFQMQVK